MKSRVRRTRTPTTTLMTVPLISCQSLRVRSPRLFNWRASRSREGRSMFQVGRVRPSHSWRQVIISGNGVVVSRSSHGSGFLFWPGVCWWLLTHPPHLSAFFLPLVIPWPRNGAVCHVIILSNACPYGLCFFWLLVSGGAFCYKVTFIWRGMNVFSWTWNDCKRIWVDTHILCLGVCRVSLPTWFLNVDNQFWLVFSTTLQYLNFYHSVISICDGRRRSVNIDSTVENSMKIETSMTSQDGKSSRPYFHCVHHRRVPGKHPQRNSHNSKLNS